METYELVYLISDGSSELEAQDTKIGIESFLAEQGEVKLTEPLKKIKLAYPIKKQTTAFLAGAFFETEPLKIADLQKFLIEQHNIIRHLIVRGKPPVKQETIEPKTQQIEKGLAQKEEAKKIKSIKEKKGNGKEEKPKKAKTKEEKPKESTIDEELEKVLNE